MAEGLVPLLRIRFQDGKADDFAVLKSFNPIPQHALEREEDIDACIYEGFLMNEADSFVTVTGCPHSSNIQVGNSFYFLLNLPPGAGNWDTLQQCMVHSSLHPLPPPIPLQVGAFKVIR